MASAYGNLPTNAAGPIVIVAHSFVQPGHADEIQELILNVQRYCLSDKEPGCIAYQTARSFVEDSDGLTKFVSYEQYKDAAAIAAHFESDAFKAVTAKIAEGVIVNPTVEYFFQFQI